jgi:biopolymer transport protein ExbB
MSSTKRTSLLSTVAAGSAVLGLAFLAVTPFASDATAQEAEPTPMVIEGPQPSTVEDLLQSVRDGWEVEKAADRQRESDFKSALSEQGRLLQEAKAKEANAEALSQRLEKDYQDKEIEIAELQEALNQRLGNLGELFGVTRQVAGDTRGNLEASITSAQFDNERIDFLEELGQSKELPSIAELERLWAEMVKEMVEQGKVVEFSAEVLTSTGAEQRDVIRAGPFTVLSNSEYILFEDGKLKALDRQPPARFLATVGDFESSSEELTGLAIDPSRGSLLAVLIETRGLVERLPDGGGVGYTVITLGALAAALGIVRLLYIFFVGRRVSAQKKNSRPDKGNPLGRILALAADNPDADREQLELMLDEAVLRESSKLESWVWLVRIVSVVAPLMGLLGTVTGMIRTFQSITLFGAGDPRMMAGGISEALVTTMLGLVVAIPLTLLHAVLSNNTKSIVDTLDEQSAGLIARQE